MNYDVGVDVGSVSINCVILDENGKVVLETPYLRHFGLIYEETHKLLENITQANPEAENSGSAQIGNLYGSSRRAAWPKGSAPRSKWRPSLRCWVPSTSCRAYGRSLKWAARMRRFSSWRYNGDEWRLESFNMNGPCASGTGSFIDQQAERLAQSIYGPDFSMDQEKLQQTLERLYRTGS